MTDTDWVKFYNELSGLAKKYKVCIVFPPLVPQADTQTSYVGSPAPGKDSVTIRVLKNRDERSGNENRTCLRSSC